MAVQQESQTKGNKASGALLTCIALFSMFFINVIVGKLNIVYGLNLPHLGDLGEFLLLFISSVSLIVAALKSEATETQS